MKIIRQTYTIKSKPADVWKALTDPKLIKQWSGATAVMSAVKGKKFSLWGGDITGRNVEVIQEKKLVQEWQYRGWEKPSTVTFTLSGIGRSSKISLIHEGVASKRIKSIADGWNAYYLGAIKQLLES